MHNFDPERSDITVILNLFDGQAERTGIETDDLVRHLLTIDIAKINFT